MRAIIFKCRLFVCLALLASVINSCGKEYDCANPQLIPALIGFTPSEIDTLILRKYKSNDNFQTLVDSFRIINGLNGQYQSSNDTTYVYLKNEKNGIYTGFDWILFIPATNRVVTIADIVSEKKTGICGSGIFSMDKFGCTCTNQVFSAKRDNQLIQFSNTGNSGYSVFIRN